MSRAAFLRKVAYLALVAALLLPLALISQPATEAVGDRPASPGGLLAQKRADFRLSQAHLGQINPASEAMKLATLGLRGIAVAVLESQADEYQKKEDWTAVSAVLEQITGLEPNYVHVWHRQGFTMSYNIAAEWDDYRDRYYWVIRGIESLQAGLGYNRHDTQLLSDVAWFTTHRIARSDERLQFRPLFRDDDDFHSRQTVQQRDNWLFGREYFLEAERVVEDLGQRPPTASPVVFYTRGPLALINDAIDLDDDHGLALQQAAARTSSAPAGPAGKAEYERRLSEIDKRFAAHILAAWERAGDQWHDFGAREFPAMTLGEPFRLDAMQATEQALAQCLGKLTKLAPGAEQAIRQERIAHLSAERREALETPPARRSKVQADLATVATLEVDASYQEIAARAEPADRTAARALADQAQRLRQLLTEITNSREIVNFDYWLLRCELERKSETRRARQALHRGLAAYQVEADLPTARRELEDAFVRWRQVLDQNPKLVADPPLSYAWLDGVRVYRDLLRQLDEPFPKPFLLQSLLDAHQQSPANSPPEPPRRSAR